MRTIYYHLKYLNLSEIVLIQNKFKDKPIFYCLISRKMPLNLFKNIIYHIPYILNEIEISNMASKMAAKLIKFNIFLKF